MKQAMPTEDDFNAVWEFLKVFDLELSELLLDGSAEKDEAVCDRLRELWFDLKISQRWQRVLWAGNVAIKNACDPKLDYVEWRPDIKAFLDSTKPGPGRE